MPPQGAVVALTLGTHRPVHGSQPSLQRRCLYIAENPAPPSIARRLFLVDVTSTLLALPLLCTSSRAFGAASPATPSLQLERISSSEIAPSVTSIQQDYNQYAETYDNLDGGVVAEALGFPEQRRRLLDSAQGAVLECAVGTGLNLQFYNSSRLKSFAAIDISPGMLAQAQQKAFSLRLPQEALSFLQADVAELPFPDNSFDTVVDTFSLCVFPDPRAALKSMARVVRPGGKILLLEHSKSGNPLLGWYQDLTAAPVKAMGKGCAWNQDVKRLVEDAGLRIERVEPHLGDLVLSVTAVKI